LSGRPPTLQELEAAIALAISDPGSVLPRDRTDPDKVESVPRWGARAVMATLRRLGASRLQPHNSGLALVDDDGQPVAWFEASGDFEKYPALMARFPNARPIRRITTLLVVEVRDVGPWDDDEYFRRWQREQQMLDELTAADQ
jgi:hypothetical protein